MKQLHPWWCTPSWAQIALTLNAYIIVIKVYVELFYMSSKISSKEGIFEGFGKEFSFNNCYANAFAVV